MNKTPPVLGHEAELNKVPERPAPHLGYVPCVVGHIAGVVEHKSNRAVGYMAGNANYVPDAVGHDAELSECSDYNHPLVVGHVASSSVPSASQVAPNAKNAAKD